MQSGKQPISLKTQKPAKFTLNVIANDKTKQGNIIFY